MTQRSYHGWRRHLDRDAFWAWVDADYPQRWAFWRARDEMDGMLIGLALTLVMVAIVLGAMWALHA